MNADVQREFDRVWTAMSRHDENLQTVAQLSTKVDTIITWLERMGRDRRWSITQTLAIVTAVGTDIISHIIK